MEMRLENNNNNYKLNEMAPYSFWNVSLEVDKISLESVKLSDENRVGNLNLPDREAEVCFSFSEIYGNQCVKVEAKYDDTGIYEPDSKTEKTTTFGKDDEKMTYIVLAIVAGCLLCVIV